mgnify:CR=1 FL=1
MKAIFKQADMATHSKETILAILIHKGFDERGRITRYNDPLTKEVTFYQEEKPLPYKGKKAMMHPGEVIKGGKHLE